MSEILLHCGGMKVDYEELRGVPIPPPTNTWTPIPHTDLLDAVKDEYDIKFLLIFLSIIKMERENPPNRGLPASGGWVNIWLNKLSIPS